MSKIDDQFDIDVPDTIPEDIEITYYLFHKNSFYNGSTNRWMWVPFRIQKRMWYHYAISNWKTDKEKSKVVFCPRKNKRKDINKEFNLVVK